MSPNEIRVWRFVALLLGAASLGVALVHAMHLPVLDKVDAENAPLFDDLYAQIAAVGAALAIGTLAALIGLVVALRERPRAQALTSVSLMMYAIGVCAWLAHTHATWAVVEAFGLATLVVSVLDESANVAVRRRHLTNPGWPVLPAWSHPRP
jgi:uncharacterized membrane protein